jgi:hypothetical protein
MMAYLKKLPQHSTRHEIHETYQQRQSSDQDSNQVPPNYNTILLALTWNMWELCLCSYLHPCL